MVEPAVQDSLAYLFVHQPSYAKAPEGANFRYAKFGGERGIFLRKILLGFAASLVLPSGALVRIPLSIYHAVARLRSSALRAEAASSGRQF